MGEKEIIDELEEERDIAERWVLYGKQCADSMPNCSGKWLRAVYLMEQTLSPRKIIFLRCRRAAAAEKAKHKMNWILFTQRRYAEEMGKAYGRPEEEFWTSEKTICNWWNEIIGKTLHIAYHIGCKFKNFLLLQ